MHFAKQKTLIGLLFLLLPVAASLAVLETPAVSDLALKIALKIARFRTGLRIETQAWDVQPLSFSASLREVSVGAEQLNLRAPEITVQISPLALLIGRVSLREMRIDSPFLYGNVPPHWLEDDGKPTKIDSSDIPTWLGTKIATAFSQLDRQRVAFDTLRITNARVQIRDLQLGKGTIDLENLTGGQVRAEWSLADLKMPKRLETVRECSGAITLLRETKSQFFMSLRDFKLELAGDNNSDVAKVEIAGRWPGEFEASAKIDLGLLVGWLQRSPLAAEAAPAEPVAGTIEANIRAFVRKRSLESISASFKTKGLSYDGYLPNNVEGELKRVGKNTDITHLKVTLPLGVGDKLDHVATIDIPRIQIENDQNLKGSGKISKAGLCAILVGADARDVCYANLHIDGDAAFEGTLEPLEIKAKTHLHTSPIGVATDMLTLKDIESPLLALNPASVAGEVTIRDKYITLDSVDATWPDTSQVHAKGKIIYKPILAELEFSTDNSHLEGMLTHFLDLNVTGSPKITAKVVYDEQAPSRKERTRVSAEASIDAFGIEGQTFGFVSGPVTYLNKEMFIGPLKLTNGGGRAMLTGWLRNTPTGTMLRFNSNLERLEVTGKAPKSGSSLFHGFVSGTVNLDGHTDFAAHPDTFINGPLNLNVETLTAFQIPFQSGTLKARYHHRILDVTEATTRKGTGSVSLAGKLYPDKGTEIFFTSDEIPLKNLGAISSLDLLQDGVVQINEGYWSPTKGWKIGGDLDRVRIAGQKLPDGKFNVYGDDNHIKVTSKFSEMIKVNWESDLTPGESNNMRFEADVKDEGFYTFFSWLKRWNSENPVIAKGNLHLDWGPASASVSTHGLEIIGPYSLNPKVQTLLKIEGEHALTWQNNRVVKNNFAITAPERLEFRADPGASEILVKGNLPAALVDLFIPTFKLRDGVIAVDGRIPLPLDLATITAALRTRSMSFTIPGIGQPVTRTEADVELAEGRLNFHNLHGKLGSGDISATGVYRIDFSRPGLFLEARLNRAQLTLLDDISVDATGEISLKGEHPPYLLAGHLLAANTLYTKEFGGKDITSVVTSPEPTLQFAMDLEIGPNSRVRNSMSSAVISGKLGIQGTDLDPEIQGTIDILSGSVFAKDNEFRISQGRASFPGGTVKVPNVNLMASTTVKDPTQDYRIQLQARGPGDQLSIDLSSEPTLTQPEIVNLLAFGVSKSTGETGVGAAQSGAFQALFGTLLGSSISKSTGVQVRMETLATQSADSKDPGKTVPKVTAVKKLSDKVTATYGRSLDVRPESNVQVDYRLLRNLNLTGVWETKNTTGTSATAEDRQRSSTGVDVRFKFDLK
ncbi:MAG: translocation/assembly module TamB domain-containing protein [Bdellovibrionales bacterium]|nr:translocation/assembly module TamB domain-containing protein [Bdellovibrionales bacterium]